VQGLASEHSLVCDDELVAKRAGSTSLRMAAVEHGSPARVVTFW
jgi:hypothetical protein